MPLKLGTPSQHSAGRVREAQPFSLDKFALSIEQIIAGGTLNAVPVLTHVTRLAELPIPVGQPLPVANH